MAFCSVFNVSRVNRGKFSWSLILFHAWTGVMYPFKSSLSAISNSFWKTSAETCHRESLSRVGGASCSSVPCIDTAWPEGCGLEICDRHGRSSLQVREDNVGNINGRYGYLRQNKVNSCLKPFFVRKLVQVFLHAIFVISSPAVLLLVVAAIVHRLTWDEPEGRGVWYRWQTFLAHAWRRMVGLSHALLMFRLVDALEMILAVGSVNGEGSATNYCPRTWLLWLDRTSGLTVSVEGCVIMSRMIPMDISELIRPKVAARISHHRRTCSSNRIKMAILLWWFPGEYKYYVS